MIVKLSGRLVQKSDQAVVIDVNGVSYEVVVPVSVIERIDQNVSPDGKVELIVHHYLQLGPSSGAPVLVGFLNEVERDFFLQFITVSGIGPRAAVKALSKPISEIAAAIEEGNEKILKTLPGIGAQKAKDIIAKLQGKVGKYGLIQDIVVGTNVAPSLAADWQAEALEVLLQLQYKRGEGLDMIQKALDRSKNIQSAEELLNEIYKQRVKG